MKNAGFRECVAVAASAGVWSGKRLPTEVTALGLGLSSDGVHDGVL